MKLTNKIQNAIITAAILHKGQVRKDNPIPFITHPYSVATILSNYTDDEDIIVAGLLHDVLEDVPSYSVEEMKKEFGEKAYEIVKGVSEDKNLNDKKLNDVENWTIRKEDYIKNLKKDSAEAMMVSCADKIHNINSLREAYKNQGDELWKKFNAGKDKTMWFYLEVLNVLKERLKNPIVSELEKDLEGLQKTIKTNDNIKSLFLGITYAEKGIVPVDVYLVNPTDESFSIVVDQGSFDGTGDELLDLGHGKKPGFELESNSFHLIDKMTDGGELDFMTYYNIYVTAKNNDCRRLFEQINGWSFMGVPEERHRKENIPILNQPGLMIGFGD